MRGQPKARHHLLPAATLALLAGMFAAACKGNSDQTGFRDDLPTVDQVAAVTVGLYPIVEQPVLPLTPETNGARIGWILDQLREATISGLPAEDGAGGFLGHISPTFQIVRKDGAAAPGIFAALDCRAEAGGYSCKLNPREIVVYVGNRSTRLIAPALASWRASGWEAEVERASPPQYAAFLKQLFPRPPIPSGDPNRLWVTTREVPESVPLPLVAGRGNDLEVLRQVMGWLRAATPGSPDTTSDPLFRGPPVPALEISWGETSGVSVRAAWLCAPIEAGANCVRSLEEVIVDDPRGLREPYHLRSPELATWLASGHVHDMRMGSYEEYQREAHW